MTQFNTRSRSCACVMLLSGSTMFQHTSSVHSGVRYNASRVCMTLGLMVQFRLLIEMIHLLFLSSIVSRLLCYRFTFRFTCRGTVTRSSYVVNNNGFVTLAYCRAYGYLAIRINAEFSSRVIDVCISLYKS